MNWKYILIVVILAAIVGGGILAWQYWWVAEEETEPPKAKSPEEILEDENVKEYSNPFYSFKYPSSYEISNEKVEAEHKEGAGGRDIYGLTLVQMDKSVEGTSYLIEISSRPNWGNLTFSQALEYEQNNLLKLQNDDKVEVIVAAGQDAVRTFVSAYEDEDSSRPGSDFVIIPTKNYIYEILMGWSDPSANSPNSKERIEFNNLLQSFTIKT